MTIALNGVIRCTSARVLMPAIGSWVVDLEVDAELVPPGPAVLTIGLSSLAGKIDDSATGAFGPTGHARLVGGLGWSKHVQPLHIHNDAGVLTTAVLQATAAEVLEVVVDQVPKVLGVDFVRSAGPASRVLAGLEWYVDTLGVTTVGPRLPVPAGPGIEILNWNPEEKLAELYSTELVLPGTVLTDARFGVATVRDVEQSFTAEGGCRAKAWCTVGAAGAVAALVGPAGFAGPKLVRMLAGLAKEAVGLPYLRRHEYRVVLVGVDGRLVLQAVDLLGETPIFITLAEVWSGVAGASQKPVPGSVVVVEFIGGDPSRPIVVAFDPGNPPAVETKIDAVRIALGTLAVDPVAKAPATQAQIAALTTAVVAIGAYIATLTTLAATPPTSTTFTLFGAGMAAPGAAVATVLGSLAASIQALVAAATSPKTFTD